ncbi:MAG: glycosyltransferase [Cyclobacteriaceae bacterium]|nr:glycosyltransferase [Cyclobacteriaceae bacterium]
MIRLSAIIITFNEEKNIGRCIDSLNAVADEIVVVDSFSTDKTREIALAKGARVIENAFHSHIDQKNFALAQATYDHVLSLDADEYLSEQLTKSILQAKSTWSFEAYSMNRLSSYGGKWMKVGAWYPDRKLRLWNRKFGVWGGDNPHDQVILNERKIKVKHLSGDLLHEAYENAADLLAKVQSYSNIFADEKRYRLKSSAFKVFYKTFYSFVSNFFLKRGILGGFEGAVIAISNTNYTFYKYSKLREANRKLRTSLIITTYNRPDALELVLLSVKNQVVLPEEVIIADDGSGQSTKAVISRYQADFPVPLIHCWHEDVGFRLSAIRNKAIALSREEYIIMIDGDMVLPKGFIRDHKRHAWKGQFIQGSRVLLLKEQTKTMLTGKKHTVSVFDSGIANRLNAIESSLFSLLFSHFRSGHTRVRGANLSFWRDDLFRVNGFNEDFQGWGREDSEFAVRMNNANIRRKHIKFAGFGYHLYHEENSRKMLSINDSILARTIALGLTRCDNGIVKSPIM